MDITFLLMAYIFACMIWKHLIRNRAQFYMGLTIVVLILLVDTLGSVIHSDGFTRVVIVIVRLLQIAGFIALILATGGLTLKSLMSEMGNAYEVMRRGETTSEVIVPLTGEQPKPREDDSSIPKP